MANSNPTILSTYQQRSVDRSRWRQIGTVLARAMLAAAYGALAVLMPPSQLVFLAGPIVVMLFITLWMLPDRRTFPLAAIEGVFAVYFVVSTLWPTYLAVVLPGLPWLTPTRVVLFVQTFLLIYSVSTSSDLRQLIGKVVKQSPWVWSCFLVWEATQIITLPISSAAGFSAKLFFDNQITLVGVFFVACLVFTRRGWASWLAAATIILAVISSIDGFYELHIGFPPWANSIPSFMRIDEKALAHILGAQSRAADGLYRVHGQFTLSLTYAEYLALGLPFLVHQIVAANGIPRRIFLIFALILVVAAINYSQSRLGLVGAMVTFITYPLMWSYRIWRTGKGGMLGPALLFAAPLAVVLSLGVVLSSHSLTTRIFGGGAQAASDDSRRVQREMAIPKVLKNPIGYGLGTSGGVLGFTNPGGFLTIDSGLLTVVLDQGIAGMVAFFGLLFAAVRRGVIVFMNSTDPEISLAGPAAIAVLNFITIRFVLSQEDNFPIAFLLLGLIMALVARDRVTRGEMVAAGNLTIDAGQDTPIPLAAAVSVARIAG